jgi:hypothetical protein
MGIDPQSRDEIAAVIGAHNATGRKPPLETTDAIRLLAVMFPHGTRVCQRNLDSLAREGFSKGTVTQLLRRLVETGLLSKERAKNRQTANIYHLNLPPLVRR